MSLITCSECGADISEKASTCPKCGYPIEENLNKEVQPLQQPEISSIKKTKAKKDYY